MTPEPNACTEMPLPVALFDADAVDVHERLTGERERPDAANADVRAGADLSGAREHDDARRAAVEQRVSTDGTAVFGRDVGDVDRRDRRAEGAQLLTASGAGDDDLIQLDRALGHHDAHVGRADVDRLAGGAKAKRRTLTVTLVPVRPMRRNRPEASVVGLLAGLPVDADLRAGERSLRAFYEHGAADRALLLLRLRGRCRDAQERREHQARKARYQLVASGGVGLPDHMSRDVRNRIALSHRRSPTGDRELDSGSGPPRECAPYRYTIRGTSLTAVAMRRATLQWRVAFTTQQCIGPRAVARTP